MHVTKNYCVAFALFAALPFAFSANVDADHISSLDNLLNGGVLSNGDAIYSDFQLLSNLGTIPIDTSLVTVEGIIGSSVLEIQGNGQFSLDAGNDSIVLQIGFNSSVVGSPWQSTGVDLTNGNAIVAGFGLIDVFNSISDDSANLLTTTNAIFDPGFGIGVGLDNQSLGGSFSDLSFVSSLTLFADSSSQVSLDSYRVTLSVPEPTSAGLFLAASFCAMIRRAR